MKIKTCEESGSLIVAGFIILCAVVIITAGGCVAVKLQKSSLSNRNRMLTNDTELSIEMTRQAGEALQEYRQAGGDPGAQAVTLVSVIQETSRQFSVQSSQDLVTWEDVMLLEDPTEAQLTVLRLLTNAFSPGAPTSQFYRIVSW